MTGVRRAVSAEARHPDRPVTRPTGDGMRIDDSLLTELGEALVDDSLTREGLLLRTGEQPTVRILPEANVVKIGGQSMIDRGRSASRLPLLRAVRPAHDLHRPGLCPPRVRRSWLLARL